MPPDWPFVSPTTAPLIPGAYDVISADPPWTHAAWDPDQVGRSARRHYATLPLAAICRLPVGSLARRDCLLALWITGPLLLSAGPRVLEAWGFRQSTVLPWVKTGAEGAPVVATGQRVGSCAEFLVLGVKGAPATTKMFRGLIEAWPVYLPRGRHSEKPAACYRWLERFFPGARRAELFSRTRRPGWAVWGNEVPADSSHERNVS